MKKSLLVLLLLVSVSLQAAPGKKSSPSNINHLYPDYMVTAGLGFAIAGGFAGFAISAGFLTGPFEKAPEIYIGADLGLDLVGAFGFGATIIHLLPTGVYRFKTSNSKWIPYAGLSIGPSIVSVLGGSYVGFAFLPRGGVDYIVSNNIAINADLKMGVVGLNGFYFKPTANVVFYF
jgi:hypothetical protein